MHASQPTDADLLSRYMQAGDEGAFAALVRTHQRLVIGTAVRVTGDAELARDVAQQVFAMLAQKAWLLSGRASLAGWLHHASRHVALRAVRSETARQRRHEQAAGKSTDTRDSDAWPVLEDALAALHEREREAVVMHYLQDRSYSEMAASLGVTEAAMRKRVSRGLENLGAQLRRRGFGGSAAALLAGAAAVQVGTPAVVVAATAATTVPFSLTLSTLMAHTAIKIAAAVTLAAAIPIAWQSQENSELRSELATLQQHPRPVAPQPLPVRDNSALHAEAADLRARLAIAPHAQGNAQTALAEAQAKVKQLEEEVVISHGKIEDLARSMVKKLMPMMEATAALEKLDGSDRTAKEAELMAKMGADLMGLMPLQKIVLKLEDRPADVAHFFAIALEEAIKLPAALRPRIESALAADFEQLKTDGLIYSLRPRENVKAWAARRGAASAEMETRVKALLPPEARNHPVFENTEGFLNVLSIADISVLGDDAKASPQPRAGNP
jgi:RNA polymerase sigma factor (sigma-70 family)